MELKFKIHRGPDGKIKGYGPNIDEYQPGIQDGDTIEYADRIPDPSVAEIAKKRSHQLMQPLQRPYRRDSNTSSTA